LFFREGSLSVIGNKIVGKDSGDWRKLRAH
jgi:hypothetical protein